MQMTSQNHIKGMFDWSWTLYLPGTYSHIFFPLLCDHTTWLLTWPELHVAICSYVRIAIKKVDFSAWKRMTQSLLCMTDVLWSMLAISTHSLTHGSMPKWMPSGTPPVKTEAVSLHFSAWLSYVNLACSLMTLAIIASYLQSNSNFHLPFARAPVQKEEQ